MKGSSVRKEGTVESLPESKEDCTHPAVRALVSLLQETMSDKNQCPPDLSVKSVSAGKYLDLLKYNADSGDDKVITLYELIKNEYGGLHTFISKHRDVFEFVSSGKVVSPRHAKSKFRFRLKGSNTDNKEPKNPFIDIDIIDRDTLEAVEISLNCQQMNHSTRIKSQIDSGNLDRFADEIKADFDYLLVTAIISIIKSQAYEASKCEHNFTAKSAIIGKKLGSIFVTYEEEVMSLFDIMKEFYGYLGLFIAERTDTFDIVRGDGKTRRFRIGLKVNDEKCLQSLEAECLVPINLRTLVGDCLVINGGKSRLEDIVTVLESNESVTDLPCNSFEELQIYYGTLLYFLNKEQSLFRIDSGCLVTLCPFGS